MIVIRVELWPGGNYERARDLGIAVLRNTCEGTADVGVYELVLGKAAEYTGRKDKAPPRGEAVAKHVRNILEAPGLVWKRGKVHGFPRQSKSFGSWDLLWLALAATLGNRPLKLLRQRRLSGWQHAGRSLYAIGTADGAGGFGMWWGPNPSRDDAMAQTGKRGDVVFRLDNDNMEPVATWDEGAEGWKPAAAAETGR